MIQTIDLRGTRPTPAELLAAVPRALTDVTSASAVAAELIDDVRARGEAALLDQAERLDRVRPDQVRVPASHITEALAGLEPAVRTAIEETIRRVRLASAAQVPPRIDTTIAEGAVITQLPALGDDRALGDRRVDPRRHLGGAREPHAADGLFDGRAHGRLEPGQRLSDVARRHPDLIGPHPVEAFGLVEQSCLPPG